MHDRIANLDVLRGFALLGLPLMNIIAFAMPFGAYFNPNAYAGDSLLNHIVFGTLYIFADQKFMSLFCLLFGASIALLADKLSKETGKSAGAFYGRMALLFVIGFCHLWFIWEGDILMFYALMGMVAFLFHRFSPSVLYALAAIALAGSVFMNWQDGIDINAMSDASAQEARMFYNPSTEQIEEYRKAITGSYSDVMGATSRGVEEDSEDTIEFFVFLMRILTGALLKIIGLMWLGMALYKSRFLQGQCSKPTYQKVAVFGLTGGFIITATSLYSNYAAAWSFNHFFTYSLAVTTVGSVLITLGYASLINLHLMQPAHSRLRLWLAPVGRMALTNYLSQSIICALLFYGYGIGLWGELNRMQLVLVAMGIGVIQIALSTVWLRYFAQGPVEWLWRCANKLKLLPILASREELTVRSN